MARVEKNNKIQKRSKHAWLLCVFVIIDDCGLLFTLKHSGDLSESCNMHANSTHEIEWF